MVASFSVVPGRPPVLTVVGEVDASTVDQFTAGLAEAAHEGQVLIDASGLTFIDSAGMRCLVSSARSGDVPCVRNAPALLRRLVELLGYEQLIHFEKPA